MKSVMMLLRPGVSAAEKWTLSGVYDAAISAACGFLLARGLAGGMLGIQWSMAAVMGTSCGRLYGVLLFAVAGAVVGTVRDGFDSKANTLLNWIVFGAYLLCRTFLAPGRSVLHSLLDGGAVACALLAAGGRKAFRGTASGLLLLLVGSLFIPMPENEQLLLRLSAVWSVLGPAGLFGGAAACLANRERDIDWRWLLAGATVGMVQK